MRKSSVVIAIVVGVALLAGGLALLPRRQRNPLPVKPPVAPPAAIEPTRVTLYYVNEQYANTGDESLPRLVAVEKELDLQGRSPAEAVVRALMNAPGKKGLSTTLNNLNLRGVKVKDEIAYVDFSSENLSGGSLRESLLIDQVIRSLGSVNGVDAVQFLVNGEKVESLMGHMDALRPIPTDR